jgi:hypothetical protein
LRSLTGSLHLDDRHDNRAVGSTGDAPPTASIPEAPRPACALVKKGSAGITASTTRNRPASLVVWPPVDIGIVISATRAGADRSCRNIAALAVQDIVGSVDVAKTTNAANMTDLQFMADSP